MNHLLKRVPANMVSEYKAMGWDIFVKEGRIVTMIWRKMESPP